MTAFFWIGYPWTLYENFNPGWNSANKCRKYISPKDSFLIGSWSQQNRSESVKYRSLFRVDNLHSEIHSKTGPERNPSLCNIWRSYKRKRSNTLLFANASREMDQTRFQSHEFQMKRKFLVSITNLARSLWKWKDLQQYLVLTNVGFRNKWIALISVFEVI